MTTDFRSLCAALLSGLDGASEILVDEGVWDGDATDPGYGIRAIARAALAKPWVAPSFEEAWAVMESRGYRYGEDALCCTRLGWEMGREFGVPDESLRKLCAAAYQVVGAADGPVEMLDNLSAAGNGEPLPHKPGAGLPWVPDSLPHELLAVLINAEAALADIGDADREPGDDVAWCERRAAEALPALREAIAHYDAQP